jgi:hypothetical protein
MNDVVIFYKNEKELSGTACCVPKSSTDKVIANDKKKYHVSLHWKFLSLTNGGGILLSSMGS